MIRDELYERKILRRQLDGALRNLECFVKTTIVLVHRRQLATHAHRTRIELACLLLTILAMVVMNFAIASIASMSLFAGAAAAWPSAALVGDLTIDFGLFEPSTVIV